MSAPQTILFARRNWLLATAAVAAAITLSACTGAPAAPAHSNTQSPANEAETPASGTFNLADVSFAQMMIPHHEQAVEMSDIMLAKTGIDARVVELAEQIKAAQAPEIEQLTAWLDGWGEPVDPMPGMDHSMDGMMTADDMQALEAAQGVEASRLFLEHMIVHHTGAIDMAKAQIAGGASDEAIAMAEVIVETQGAEIATMQAILDTL